MHGVDEELRATGVGLAGVGHGEGTGLIGELGARRVSAELVGNVAAGVTSDCLAVGQSVGGAALGTTGAGTAAVGVSGVGATELVHEVGNHAVEVQTIVVSISNKSAKVEMKVMHRYRGRIKTRNSVRRVTHCIGR